MSKLKLSQSGITFSGWTWLGQRMRVASGVVVFLDGGRII